MLVRRVSWTALVLPQLPCSFLGVSCDVIAAAAAVSDCTASSCEKPVACVLHMHRTIQWLTISGVY
jgi:hypothetical protein